MERATLNTRTDDGVVPIQLRKWLAAQGLTIAQWRADPRSKATGKIAPPASLPGRPALSIARKRLALIG